ncbi:GNAT family N-acetyltransferase [Glutamicibacter sp.]|uniref:GNAT family N-acetyltransferase n=1 Tax=Glutamicibacter sp. TaxID=1931995 RepID=UPI003D6B2F91
MKIRTYAESDAPATLGVFMSAITQTAALNYTQEQTDAWARPNERNLDHWNAARNSLNTIVADINGNVAGFSDVSDSGYIDMMFVAPEFGRRGVASALLAHLQRQAISQGTPELTTHASITARPFFERHGFTVIAEQHPITNGVQMVNYQMRLQLSA